MKEFKETQAVACGSLPFGHSGTGGSLADEGGALGWASRRGRRRALRLHGGGTERVKVEDAER